MGNPNGAPAKYKFKKGDPNRPKGGRPKGSKDKLTLIKEQILDTVLGLDLKKDVRISKNDLVKLAAGFVPKEIKGSLEGSLEITWLT